MEFHYKNGLELVVQFERYNQLIIIEDLASNQKLWLLKVKMVLNELTRFLSILMLHTIIYNLFYYKNGLNWHAYMHLTVNEVWIVWSAISVKKISYNLFKTKGVLILLTRIIPICLGEPGKSCGPKKKKNFSC